MSNHSAHKAPLKGPDALSASSSSLFNQCRLKWRFRYIDKLPDPPGIDALVGSFAHRVLEELLKLPNGYRSQDQARSLATQVWGSFSRKRDVKNLKLDAAGVTDFKVRAWQAITGLWELEDPNTCQVKDTERFFKVDLAGVPFRGVIDRLEQVDGALVVSDYKSGKAPNPQYAEKALRQVMYYAAAVEVLTNSRPALARLLYLGQRIESRHVNDTNIAQAHQELSEAWSEIQQAVKADDFGPSPSPLCAWCVYVNRCPVGQAEVKLRLNSGKVRSDAPALAALGLQAETSS